MDYIELILCRDIFHCTPSQLDEEDGKRIVKLLMMANTEAKLSEARAKTSSFKPGARGRLPKVG